MKTFMIFIIICITFLALVSTNEGATKILVIESIGCGRCKSFNVKQIRELINTPNYNDVVDILLLPHCSSQSKIRKWNYYFLACILM
jgi:hypothetical protein